MDGYLLGRRSSGGGHIGRHPVVTTVTRRKVLRPAGRGVDLDARFGSGQRRDVHESRGRLVEVAIAADHDERDDQATASQGSVSSAGSATRLLRSSQAEVPSVTAMMAAPMSQAKW